MNNADIIAKATGAISATHRVERRDADGSLAVVSIERSDYVCGGYASCGVEDGEEVHARACQEENGAWFRPLS